MSYDNDKSTNPALEANDDIKAQQEQQSADCIKAFNGTLEATLLSMERIQETHKTDTQIWCGESCIEGFEHDGLAEIIRKLKEMTK